MNKDEGFAENLVGAIMMFFLIGGGIFLLVFILTLGTIPEDYDKRCRDSGGIPMKYRGDLACPPKEIKVTVIEETRGFK